MSDPYVADSIEDVFAVADTAPLAICRAALAAVGPREGAG